MEFLDVLKEGLAAPTRIPDIHSEPSLVVTENGAGPPNLISLARRMNPDSDSRWTGSINPHRKR
ncbi:hypothetical protein JTP77_044760, partial [Streptomyces sp. S9]|nr:hypothetical protein [Streptomyces sp. S9]